MTPDVVNRYPSSDEFATAVGTPFTVAVDSGAVDAELVECRQLASQPYDMFSLVFRLPTEVEPAQGTYEFRHDRLGGFTALAVPVARTADGVDLEVTFALPPTAQED